MELTMFMLLIFLMPYIDFGIAQDPPFIDTSYRAVGEIIIDMSPKDVVTIAFEENFDYDGRKSVLTAHSAGFTTTLFEDLTLNQTFKYDEALVDGQMFKVCKVYTPSEWRQARTPPDLEIFEFQMNSVYFPMMQLLWGLSPRFIKPGSSVEYDFYRDIPCTTWTYELNYTSIDKSVDYAVDVKAYWASGTYNMSTAENIAPIGFKIRHNGFNKTSGKPVQFDQYVNVMYFIKDYFNREAFLPIQGIFCPGRKSPKPFPQFGDFTALSAKIEFEWKHYYLISNVDMDVDSSSKIVQLKYDPEDQDFDFKNPKRKTTSVLIANHVQMIAYDIRGDNCQVIDVKQVTYDPQTIYDTRLLSALTSDDFFGHGVNYVYIGETTKRGIPCHLWQGQRRSWPPSVPNSITTVWEWCIAERVGNPIVFENCRLPIVSLDITVTESHLTEAAGQFILGTKLSYNFYDLVLRKPSYLRTSEFDISPCFSQQYKEWLQFQVNVKSTKNALKNATEYADFIDKWRTVIYGGIGIEPSTLRVARVRTLLEDKVLFVQFILLDRHPDTPTHIEKDVDLSEMKKRLASAIDGGGVNIDWLNMNLKALKGSLETVFEVRQPQTTVNPEETTKETTPTKPPIHTKPSPKVTTKSTPSKMPPNTPPSTIPPVTKGVSTTTGKDVNVTDAPEGTKRSTEKRHTPGTMAGLGIGMLLLGFSLGAGGTFAKFRYFPNIW